MATFGWARITRVVAVMAAAVLAGCGSPYEDIRLTAAQSPGIGIADVEMMAFNSFLEQGNRGNTLSASFPTNLFLDPPLSEVEIREVYLSDRQGCGESRADESFRCLRRVLIGNTPYDVAVEYEVRGSRTRIGSFFANLAPQL